jgi:hypothetical protein
MRRRKRPRVAVGQVSVGRPQQGQVVRTAELGAGL